MRFNQKKLGLVLDLEDSEIILLNLFHFYIVEGTFFVIKKVNQTYDEYLNFLESKTKEKMMPLLE